MRKVFMDHSEVVEPLECPKCGKRSLIQQSIHKYHCLWCHFQRDISEPDVEGVFSFLAQVMALFFTILLVWIVVEERSPNNSQVPTSQVPTSQVPMSQVPTPQIPASQVPNSQILDMDAGKAKLNQPTKNLTGLTLGGT